MIHLQELESKLKAINANFKFFGRPEVRELAKIVSPNEDILQATNGYYEAGFALLVMTNHRLLLIDRKPMFLTLEDIRFDMISEVDFNHRLLNATIRVYTPNKSLVFTTWNHAKLRDLANHLQEHILQTRQHNYAPQHMYQQSNPIIDMPSEPPRLLKVDRSEVLPTQLAKTALRGASTSNLRSRYMTRRFVAPLSRNPYVKTPLMVRNHKLPSL